MGYFANLPPIDTSQHAGRWRYMIGGMKRDEFMPSCVVVYLSVKDSLGRTQAWTKQVIYEDELYDVYAPFMTLMIERLEHYLEENERSKYE